MEQQELQLDPVRCEVCGVDYCRGQCWKRPARAIVRAEREREILRRWRRRQARRGAR